MSALAAITRQYEELIRNGAPVVAIDAAREAMFRMRLEAGAELGSALIRQQAGNGNRHEKGEPVGADWDLGEDAPTARDYAGSARVTRCDVYVTGDETAPVNRRDRTVLDEAKKLVHGDRNEAYGNPADDFGRAAAMLNGLYRDKLKPGESFSATDIARIQIVVKLSRSMHSKRRDSWVDVAGYAETADWAEEAESK